MANIKIHLINRSGQSDKTIEINDGDKAHYIIWEMMFDLYYNEFIDEIEKPEWIPDDYVMDFSDIQLSDNMLPFWNLSHNENVNINHRIVFGLTFNNLIIFENDLEQLIGAISIFIKTFSNPPYLEFFNHIDFSILEKFVDELNKIKENHKDMLGISFSSSESPSIWDEFDENGKHIPYNIFKSHRHTNLFEKIIKK